MNDSQEKECFMCTSPADLWETEHWKVSLAPVQSNLGRHYITAKRHVSDVDALTTDEYLEFQHVYGTTKIAIRSAFNATL